nr:hypothetical protein [Tanacetum cinerariifolium]
MSASMEACVARHAALPSALLLIPSLPLPLPSPLTTSPTDIGAPLGYREPGIRMRALLPSTSRKTDIPEADIPPQKRACLTTPAPGFEIGESSVAGAARQPGPTKSDLRRCRVEQAGYGITNTQRTGEFEKRFEEAQDDRDLLRARVNTLFRDKPDHRRIAMLIDREEMYSREAWAFSMDRSSAIAAHVRTLETQVLIDRGVAAVLAERDADTSRNGNNNNDSGTGERRQMTTPRECSYIDFLKCQPMSFQVDDEPMWDVNHVVALTPGSAITIPETTNKFAIKERQKHGCRNLTNELLKHRMNFEPLSLADFPPALFDRLLEEIHAFFQHEKESLTDAWLRMKEML